MPMLRVVLLVLTLLWAQLAAIAHVTAHAQQDEERPHPPCALCVAYAAFDHAVAATPGPLLAEYVCPRPAHASGAAFAPFSSRQYRARAPPQHLV
jgi:hypothetical protein